jgi:ABC-type nitrate/sulfonate/bicarbonate transport system substrate-binding protein
VRRTRIAIVLICVVAIAAGAVGIYTLLPSESEGNRSVALGGLGSTGSTALFWFYGEEKGIFDKYDLNVTYHSFKDVYTMMLAFFTGRLDAAVPSPGIAGAAYADGESFKIGMAVGIASNLILLTTPDITDVTELKGKKLGVIGTSSDSYYVIKWYLESKGLDMESDVEVVKIAKPSSLATSFQTGQLDAVVLFSGYAAEIMASGGVPLVRCTDAAEEVIGHPAYTTVTVLGDDVMGRGTVARDFLRALREVAEGIKADKEEAVRLHAELSGQSIEMMETVMGMLTLVGDLDKEVQEGLLAFAEHAAQDGYFETPFEEDIFYHQWR